MPTDEPTVIHTARVGSGGSDTQAGSVMGTPAFMSPEQAAGEIDKLDERADVFGLGAVLCVILTGEPPYQADTAEAIRLMAVRGKLTEAFARLDACGSDPELVDLCKQCLAAERDERPRHAGEVAGALGTYLARVEQRAQEAEVARAAAAAETKEQKKRRKVQAALGLAWRSPPWSCSAGRSAGGTTGTPPTVGSRPPARQSGPAATRRVQLLRLRFQEGLAIRDIAARWSEDAAKLHHEYATARQEFLAALRSVVRFHHPRAAAAELDQACGELLGLLG